MMHFNIRRLGALVAAGMATTGCLSDPSNPNGLGTINPLAIDPATTAIVLDLPQSLHLNTGDATLRLKVEGVFEEAFALAVRRAGHAAPRAAAPRHRLIAGIAVADWERYTAAQAKARAARDGGAAGKGSISVSVGGGCTNRGADLASEYVGVSMRTNERTMPLARFDLKGIAGTLPACRAADAVPVTGDKDS